MAGELVNLSAGVATLRILSNFGIKFVTRAGLQDERRWLAARRCAARAGRREAPCCIILH
jgi:hypothetical protein